MGKKFIIELCDKPMKNENGNDIWRVKGFNTLVFDQNGLDKLKEYDEAEEKTHEFKVGDICTAVGCERWFIITKIYSDYYHCMWNDGSHNCIRKSILESKAKFIRHSSYFEAFLAEVFR